MMKRTLLFVLLSVSALPGSSSASCGSASCPLNNFMYLHSGFLLFRFSREYINQDQIYVASHLSFVGAIPYDHDEVQTINERTLIEMQIGLTDRIGLAINVPFVSRQHSHIHHDMGNDEMETWNFSGLGDIVISGQYSLIVPDGDFDPYVSFSAGVKLPTGITNAANGTGEEAEVTIQPGSGSTDAIFAVYYRQTIASLPTLSGEFSALPLTAGVSYRLNGRGTDGWRFGNILLAHLGTSYQFSAQGSFLLQINGRFQGHADVGTTGEPGENTGGTWIFASPGFSVSLAQNISAYSYVQIPVYRNVNGIQQTSRYNIQFGISSNVDLFGAAG